MTPFEQAVTLIPKLDIGDKDALIGMLLDGASPCTTSGHNYIKVSLTKGVQGFFGSTPDVAHLVCKRCAKKISIALN